MECELEDGLYFALHATIMWSLWKRRNLKLWQHKDETNDQVLTRATTLLEDWKAAQTIRNAGGTPSTVSHQESSSHDMIRWERPARGGYKCNIDVSFSSFLNRVGIGVCIRDDVGDFVLARSFPLYVMLR